MWESTFFVDFQGLWEGWDGFIVPRFPSARHFHRFGRRDDLNRARWPFGVAVFVAVGSHLRHWPRILPRLDERERVTEPLILDHGRRADALILVEDAVGKHAALRAHLQPAVREVVDVDILAAELFAYWATLEDQLLAVVGQGELIADMALLAVTQHVVEPVRFHAECLMEVSGLVWPHGEALVEAAYEAGHEGVARIDRGNVLDPQFLHQPILQGAVRAFDPALGLAGVGADDLDVQFSQRTAELRHAGAALRLRPVDPEDRVLVRVKRDRAAVSLKIPPQRFEVARRALARNEPELHQPAGRVVYEDQQRAGLAALLEPAVLGAIDLDQFAQALPPEPRLVEGAPLLARQPQSVGNHPPTQGLPANLDAVLFKQHLSRKRRAEVSVLRLYQLDRILPHAWVHLPVRGPATRPVDHRRAAQLLIPGQQPKSLPPRQPHHRRPGLHRTPAGKNLGQHFNAFQIPFAHL
jgi:hypothetical protein